MSLRIRISNSVCFMFFHSSQSWFAKIPNFTSHSLVNFFSQSSGSTMNFSKTALVRKISLLYWLLSTKTSPVKADWSTNTQWLELSRLLSLKTILLWKSYSPWRYLTVLFAIWQQREWSFQLSNLKSTAFWRHYLNSSRRTKSSCSWWNLRWQWCG